MVSRFTSIFLPQRLLLEEGGEVSMGKATMLVVQLTMPVRDSSPYESASGSVEKERYISGIKRSSGIRHLEDTRLN